MEKTIFLSFILLLALCAPAHSTYYSQSKAYDPAKLYKTRLHFFLHDTLSGKNPTAVQIAGPKNSAESKTDPTPFGTVYALDDPLTEGPSLKSEVVGDAKGMYLSSSQGKNPTLVLYVDLGFTTGRFNGSSLSVFSRNPITETNREMAVVGGRGMFRRAQGTVFVKTFALNTTTGDAVLEYTVEVYHPEGY